MENHCRFEARAVQANVLCHSMQVRCGLSIFVVVTLSQWQSTSEARTSYRRVISLQYPLMRFYNQKLVVAEASVSRMSGLWPPKCIFLLSAEVFPVSRARDTRVQVYPVPIYTVSIVWDFCGRFSQVIGGIMSSCGDQFVPRTMGCPTCVCVCMCVNRMVSCLALK